jgi:DNA invertase Pin-like site-specific DNA recombinase
LTETGPIDRQNAGCEACGGKLSWEWIDDEEAERWLGICPNCARMRAFLPDEPDRRIDEPLTAFLGEPDLTPSRPPWIRAFRASGGWPWLAVVTPPPSVPSLFRADSAHAGVPALGVHRRLRHSLPRVWRGAVGPRKGWCFAGRLAHRPPLDAALPSGHPAPASTVYANAAASTDGSPRWRGERVTVKVIGYTRVSTAEQGQSGFGLEGQRTAIEQACPSRGWTLVRIEQDIGSGKTTAGRLGLARALDDCRRRRADGLIVARLDRMSRSVGDAAAILEESARQEFAIIALDFGLDTSTAAGELVANVLMSVARWERRVIAERISAAMRAKTAGAWRPPQHQLHAAGESIRAIARKLKRHPETVRRVLTVPEDQRR